MISLVVSPSVNFLLQSTTKITILKKLSYWIMDHILICSDVAIAFTEGIRDGSYLVYLVVETVLKEMATIQNDW